jgi:hypothetical protein
MVCVPESYWRPQMERALQELRKARSKARFTAADEIRIFLTENDTVTAWILRCVIGQAGMNPDRTVSAAIDAVSPHV